MKIRRTTSLEVVEWDQNSKQSAQVGFTEKVIAEYRTDKDDLIIHGDIWEKSSLHKSNG